MAYVATRGGERAILEAEKLYREGVGPIGPERVAMVEQALPWLVDRVMGEASLYAPDLAALAIAQTGGDLYESVLLLRAWRTTQSRLQVAAPVSPSGLLTHRRISAAFRDVPGGQVLGPTLDYSHRLLATEALESEVTPEPVTPADAPMPATLRALADWQKAEGLIADPTPARVEPDDIPDLTREPLMIPAARAHRLQGLARADTGGLLALGYSAQRGYGSAHPTVNELRLGAAEVMVRHPSGSTFSAGRVKVSQCEMVSKGAQGLKLGFCATLGWNEVKTIAGSTLDLNMTAEGGERPAEQEEFVLYHTEPVESSGFCIHLKLPHYVTFQSALDHLRGIRREQGLATRTADDVMAEALARTAAAATLPETEPAE